MSAPVVSSWTCPQCRRLVPRREPRCHCGLERSQARIPERATVADGVSVFRDPRSRPLLIATALAAGCSLVIYAVATQPADQPPGTSAGSTHREPRYPALPVLTAESAPPRARATPGKGRDEAWARAVALLAPPLRKVATDSAALELSYRPFAKVCLPSMDGMAAAGDWLASLETAERSRSGIAAGEDCEGARKSLAARADTVKSALEAAETLARASGVLPAHWRRLLAMHGLEAWDHYQVTTRDERSFR
jgi:hypothetical protein